MNENNADFWLSSGHVRLEQREDGRHAVTPAFLQAYVSRPELALVEESCEVETALHEELQRDPALAVSAERLATLADPDARENYELVLGFRDRLMASETLEDAYLKLVQSDSTNVPGLFLSQLAHAMLRGVLQGCTDPIRLRAAEVFFRTQTVSTDDGRIMLADEEIVEMYTATGGFGGLGQLLANSDTPMKSVELDVLDEDTKEIYWQRSDRFDTVVDFRFTQPALDAFARVMEAWILHFMRLRTRIHPMQRIDDEKWSWHIGLDADATAILNALYDGAEVPLERMQQIIALFRMEVLDRDRVQSSVRGRPIYLGLAKTADGKMRMKPQNLLVNLPLVPDA